MKDSITNKSKDVFYTPEDYAHIRSATGCDYDDIEEFLELDFKEEGLPYPPVDELIAHMNYQQVIMDAMNNSDSETEFGMNWAAGMGYI